MHDFEVQRCTRRCAATGRELAPRETIYSKLVVENREKGREFVRYDYCQAAWSPPSDDEDASWWKWRLPEPGERKVAWAPHEVLLRFFEELQDAPAVNEQDAPMGNEPTADNPHRRALRYVAGLLLVRRRIVRIQRQESLPEGGERLILFAAQTEREYEVLVAEPTPEQAAAIQCELMQLLSSNTAPSNTPPSITAPSQTSPAEVTTSAAEASS